MSSDSPIVIDPMCGRVPDEIDEYYPEFTGSYLGPESYVIRNEGTFNPSTGHFLCTQCYIAANLPLNYEWDVFSLDISNGTD